MIGLELLAAHLIGDFVLSNRWQAARKLESSLWRTYHVAMYSLPFVPLAYLTTGALRATNFLILLFCLHWLTDCQRFRSTLGDVIHWKFRTAEQRRAEWLDQPGYESFGRTSDSLPPNPWTPIPLMIDQSLHVAQLAVLGAAFLT